jgi:diguanylate cyclase (GGDEF)-like protein
LNSKYKIIVIITSLLLILSISLSSISYFSALNSTQEQLKIQSLPLSLDNIYTDIQKSIIEPHLVSSMMANDTFLQEWLVHGEKDSSKIIRYLKSIKNKYNMFSTFFVSEKTNDYYTNDGFVEKLSKNNSNHKWYYDFKDIQESQELNLDYNKNISNSLILFINYKILDKNFNYLGTTGVALKLSYINDLLKKFRQEHHFKVTFFNPNGDIVLAEESKIHLKNINNIIELKPYKDIILSKELKSFEYIKNNQKHIVNTKYIPELNLYLSVDANLEDFIKKTKQTLYVNIITSLIITILILIIVFLTIKKYSHEIEQLSNYDTLTGISNRRHFKELFHKQISLSNRDKKDIAIIFFDIDNFKLINDNLGHNIGDEILKSIAKILSINIRESDFVARWGGEEFVITLIDSSIENSLIIAEKLRLLIEKDLGLQKLANSKVTGSFGLSMFIDTDTQDEIIARADNAMYESKENGKNKITVK